MKIATWFRLVTALSLGAYLVIAIGVFVGARKMAGLSRQHAVTDEINYLIEARNIAFDEFLDGNVRAARQWRAGQNRLKSIVNDVAKEFTSPRKRKILLNMGMNLEKSGTIFSILEQRHAENQPRTDGQRQILTSQLVFLSRALIVDWNRLSRHLRTETARMHTILAGAMLSALLLLFSLTVFHGIAISNRVVRRIREVRDRARRIAAGRFSDDITYRHADELGELAAAFNHMKRRVYAARGILERTNEELEKKVQERTDLLQRKTIALEASNKELRRFAYVASHDLKEPLRVIFNYLDLLKNSAKNRLNESDRRFIDVASKQALRMRDLIQDVLGFSRIESLEYSDDPVDCNAAVRTAMANLEGPIKDAGAEVEIEPLPPVRGSLAHFVQLFQNLIENAIKYRGPERPRIRIYANESDAGWIISVSDNGLGIDREYRDKVFEMFLRLHPASHSEGTGIGLAICKKIVESYGGAIWVDSEPGKGSTFSMRFPVRIPAVP